MCRGLTSAGRQHQDTNVAEQDIRSLPSLLAAGGWRLAAGGWRLAAGGWRLAAGGWRLAAGGWRLTTDD